MAIIKKYSAYSFEEYVGIVSQIGRDSNPTGGKPPVLWFRGHRDISWNLRPTLLRGEKLGDLGLKKPASSRAMSEEIRKEHYIAKNSQFFDRELQSGMEWFEVMQHHGVYTRLLDWTESSMHALVFALECFFDQQKPQEERVNCAPCVWVMDTIKWNHRVLTKILNNQTIIRQFVRGLNTTQDNQSKIELRIYYLKCQLDHYFDFEGVGHLKEIFNLSYIDRVFSNMGQQKMIHELLNGELYYCLFALLDWLYLSTDLRSYEEVYPLAIVEAYHSERIASQKGAFSIFPYYREDQAFLNLSSLGINMDAMENMDDANEYLHCIRLYNQDEIAFDMMNAGVNVTWLYPEMPVVANAIEKREIYK